MADKFQNGLYLVSTDGNYNGQTFSRWLVEFLTQVVGMTLFDSKTGDGGWTATIATGSAGASVVGEVAQFDMTGDARSWTSSDIGRYITITGMSVPARDGIYRIKKIISTKIIELDIRFGVHEDGIPLAESGVSWRLWEGSSSYRPPVSSWAVVQGDYKGSGLSGNWHTKIESSNWPQDIPWISIGPWATWNAGTDAWSDSRNTTSKAIYRDPGTAFSVFAVADTNRAIISWFCRTTNYWGIMYFGEFTANYPVGTDPKPAMVWSGMVDRTTYYALGYNCDNDANAPKNGMRALSSDDTTVLTYFPEIPSIVPYDGSSAVRIRGVLRRWSQFSRKFYRFEIPIMASTAGRFERRGVLKDVWIGGQDYVKAMPFGASREYLHLISGISIPWNGSKVHVQF